MSEKELDKQQKCITIVYTVSWNQTKSDRLKRIRGISFEEIIKARFIGIENHPSRADQWILIYEHKGYIWAVPFVYDAQEMFLKTIYASRKFNKIYKKRSHDEKNEIN